MSETEESVFPVLILIAVATIAASTIMQRLGLFSPAVSQVRTAGQKAKMKEIKELRKVKAEYLAASQQDAEEIAQDENGVGSD